MGGQLLCSFCGIERVLCTFIDIVHRNQTPADQTRDQNTKLQNCSFRPVAKSNKTRLFANVFTWQSSQWNAYRSVAWCVLCIENWLYRFDKTSKCWVLYVPKIQTRIGQGFSPFRCGITFAGHTNVQHTFHWLLMPLLLSWFIPPKYPMRTPAFRKCEMRIWSLYIKENNFDHQRQSSCQWNYSVLFASLSIPSSCPV